MSSLPAFPSGALGIPAFRIQAIKILFQRAGWIELARRCYRWKVVVLEHTPMWGSSTVAELRRELVARSLPTSGRKADLVARLDDDDAHSDLDRDVATDATDAETEQFTRADVARHNKDGDLWIVIDNAVYDISTFLKRHPGGSAPLRYAGLDATKVRIYNTKSHLPSVRSAL